MAERHFVNGGGDLNWNLIANWSLTEGGAGGQTVPSATEDVFLDAGSPACTITATAYGKTLTTSAYTGTFTFNAQLLISGNITIGANLTFAGTVTNYLAMVADGTWTTNGKTIGQDIWLGRNTLASIAIALADALTTVGAVNFGCTTATVLSGDFHITGATAAISGTQTVTIVHDVTISGLTTISDATVINGAFNWNTGGITTTGALSGTTTIILTGGTWTGAAGALSNNCTLAGNITISGIVLYNTGTLLYSSGSITTTGSTLSLNLTAGVNASAVTWDNITIGGATVTITLGSALVSTGLLTISTTTTLTFAGAFAISAGTCNITGGLTITIVEAVTISGLTTITPASVIDGNFHWHTGGLTTTASLTGTTTIVLTGGTWTGAVGSLSNNLIFDGNSTISGTVLCLSPTITWVSGTITVGTSILSLGAATHTLDTSGMSFANITITVATTITINSPLTITGTLTLPALAVTFDGTSGWTVGTLQHTAITTVSKTFTFKQAVTYAITTAMTVTHAGSQTVRYTYTSADANIKTIITLSYGATQNIAFLDPTRIDSSLGQTIFSFKGVITDSFNWSKAIANGNVICTAGGESVTVAGITKDNAGVALGSCDVYLFRDNGNDTATYIAYVESNAVTGAYSFTVFPGSTYFVVAFKGGATPVMDVTDRTVAAV